MYTAIIVDDMTLARANMRALLEAQCPNITSIHEAEGVVSGVKKIKALNPDIVFLDIEMNDGNGFDLLDILPEENTRVIFVTASQEYAIKAFRYAAVDYILKPVDPDLLSEAVNKVLAAPQLNKDQVSLVKEVVQNSDSNNRRLVLHTAEKIKVCDIQEIVRCESMGNYTQFYFADKQKLLVTKTLKEFDKILTHHKFLRCHQSHLVNGNFISSYVKTEGGYILMKDQARVPVSVRKKAEIVKALETL